MKKAIFQHVAILHAIDRFLDLDDRYIHFGPTQVKYWLSISSIFDAMNFQHFWEMLEFNLYHFQKMLEIHCIKIPAEIKSPHLTWGGPIWMCSTKLKKTFFIAFVNCKTLLTNHSFPLIIPNAKYLELRYFWKNFNYVLTYPLSTLRKLNLVKPTPFSNK